MQPHFTFTMPTDTGEASFRIKAGAFCGLVAIQTCIGAINKVAYVSGGGHFTFAPTSALTMAEMAKFCLSFYFHVNDFENFRDHDARCIPVQHTFIFVIYGIIQRHQHNCVIISCIAHFRMTAIQKWPKASEEILEAIGNPMVLFNIWTLAFLYCFNNQLQFFLNVDADPGTIFLFKSGSTFITAIMMATFLNRPVSQLQWAVSEQFGTHILFAIINHHHLRLSSCK